MPLEKHGETIATSPFPDLDYIIVDIRLDESTIEDRFGNWVAEFPVTAGWDIDLVWLVVQRGVEASFDEDVFGLVSVLVGRNGCLV